MFLINYETGFCPPYLATALGVWERCQWVGRGRVCTVGFLQCERGRRGRLGFGVLPNVRGKVVNLDPLVSARSMLLGASVCRICTACFLRCEHEGSYRKLKRNSSSFQKKRPLFSLSHFCHPHIVSLESCS